MSMLLSSYTVVGLILLWVQSHTLLCKGRMELAPLSARSILVFCFYRWSSRPRTKRGGFLKFPSFIFYAGWTFNKCIRHVRLLPSKIDAKTRYYSRHMDPNVLPVRVFSRFEIIFHPRHLLCLIKTTDECAIHCRTFDDCY
jgi:hypothetical protein